MNIVEAVHTTLEEYFPEHSVVNRPLRLEDPAKSIGILVVDAVPQDTSKQIGQREPALIRYQLRIHNMIKHTNEVEGKAMFSLDAKSIKAVLYRDPTLTLSLAALQETLLGTTEVAKQWGVSRQRFLSNELPRSQFVYLAVTEFWLEAESIEL